VKNESHKRAQSQEFKNKL